MFDLILKGGEVFQGSGKESYIGDVAIEDGFVAAVEPTGNLNLSKAEEVVDVAGLVVSAGFIDMHTHSDFTLIADGRAESQVHQGVTTEVIGQCGISCAPVNSQDDIRQVAPWYIAAAKHDTWLGFGDYLC